MDTRLGRTQAGKDGCGTPRLVHFTSTLMGVPIPAFHCVGCRQVLLDAGVIQFIKDRFEKDGADSWFYKDVSYFLPPGSKCAKCGGEQFVKEMDIFDVWFESGSSHHAVLRKRPELSYPANLYLEGTDQHRGVVPVVAVAIGWRMGQGAIQVRLTHGLWSMSRVKDVEIPWKLHIGRRRRKGIWR